MRCLRVTAVIMLFAVICFCFALRHIKTEKSTDEFVSESELLPDVPQGYCLERPQIDSEIVLPLEKGKVSSLFGMRLNPVNGKYKFHAGYDIASKKGAQIRCVMNGKVKKSGYDSGYGNFVTITHENSIETLYAHMDKVFVKSGCSIKQGETIGTIGHTGAATGSHLHFELIIDGVRYDPEWILCGAYN